MLNSLREKGVATGEGGGKRGFPGAIAALIGAAVVVTEIQQFTTLSKFQVMPPAAGFKSPGDFAREIQAAVNFQPWDWGLIVLLAGTVFAVLVMEIRGRQLTRLFDYCFAHETRTLVLLIISCTVLLRYYFTIGQLSWAGDAAEHIVYSWIAAKAWAAGELPIWTNYVSGGSPFLQFYGFLFFYVVAIVDLFVGEIFTALKLVLGIAHICSGIAAYAWFKVTFGSRSAAYLGALAYILSFWHTQQVLFMGRLPLSLFYAVLPLPFFFFETFRSWRKKELALGLGAASLGSLVFIHPGYAFWAAFFLVLYIGLRVLFEPAYRQPMVAWGSALVLLGTVFGSAFGLPMVLEANQTSLETGVSLSGVPDPSWQHLLGWSNFRLRLLALPDTNHHWYGGYLGLSLVFIAAVSVLAARGFRLWRFLAPGVAGMGVVLVIIFGYRLPLLQSLAPVTALNSGRYLLFAVFFLAYLVATAVVVAERLAGSSNLASRIYIAMFAVILIDLGPTTFQHPYVPRSAIPISFASPTLQQIRASVTGRDGSIPNFRTYITTENSNPFQAIGWLCFASGIPTFQGLYNEAPRAHRKLVEPWETFVEPVFNTIDHARELLNHPQADIISGGLVLFNVRRIVALQEDELLTFDWNASTPILVSPRVGPFPYDEFERMRSEGKLQSLLRGTFPDWPDLFELARIFKSLWLVRALGVDAENGTCEQIILRDLHYRDDLETSPSVTVVEHNVWNQRVEIVVEISEQCYARLAYAYYPELRVAVNEIEVPALETAGGFIALKLSAGKNRIVITPQLSSLRKTTWGASILLLVLVPVGVGAWRRRTGGRSN